MNIKAKLADLMSAFTLMLKTMIVLFDTNWTNAPDERRQEMRDWFNTFIQFPSVLGTVGYLIGGWTFAFYFFILPYAGLAVWWLKAEIGNLLNRLRSQVMGYYTGWVVWAKA
jgi:hypothetical protein